MHSTIFALNHISEDELNEDAQRFNPCIDYVSQEKSMVASVDWLEQYLSGHKIKVNRVNCGLLVFSVAEYLRFILSNKSKIIAKLNTDLSKADSPEAELRAYKSAGYDLYQDDKFGFLFYSDKAGMMTINDLCWFENDDGMIELEIVETFDYHS